MAKYKIGDRVIANGWPGIITGIDESGPFNCVYRILENDCGLNVRESFQCHECYITPVKSEEKKMKFIPGKKYTRISNGTVHTFVGSTTNEYRVWENDCSCIWSENYRDSAVSWKEYKEPVVHTRYVHWWRNPFDKTVGQTTDSNPEWTGCFKHLKTEKITYTEE